MGVVPLLLEEILEGLAGVVGARGRGRHGTGCGGLRVGSGSGIFFDGHTKFIKGAVVAGIFRGNTLGDGLHAFKLRAGIEEAALLAAVELEVALGAGTVGVKTGGENSTAIGTSGPSNSADHARRARPKLIGATRPARWGLFFVRSFALLALFGIAVTAVTILSIHKYLRPPATTDCNSYNTDFCAGTLANLASIQSDCYTRPDRTDIPLEFACRDGHVREQEMGHLCF